MSGLNGSFLCGLSFCWMGVWCGRIGFGTSKLRFELNVYELWYNSIKCGLMIIGTFSVMTLWLRSSCCFIST